MIVLGRLVRIRAGEYRRGIGGMRNENGVLVVLDSIAYARASQFELRDRATYTYMHSKRA